MKKLKIALDWTANTNHTGFYVAQQLGFYKQAGIDLVIETPDQDNYAVTPAKKVELGTADCALCPFESIISYRTKNSPFDAVALATIFQEDISSIATLKSKAVESPKELDGLVYASYKARYEDEIVKQMVRNDGGKGAIKLVYPEKLGIWETILTGKADATWIFENWEGIRAKNEGVALNLFRMRDYDVPYGYSPVIMAGKGQAVRHSKLFGASLEETKKGYLYAKDNPSEAVAFICPFISEQDKNIDLIASQEFSSRYYGDSNTWGLMEEKHVERFLKWLQDNNLEKRALRYAELVHLF